MTISTPADTPSRPASGSPPPAAVSAASGARALIGDCATAGGTVAPAVVYLLADHLDAVLARGEDLLAASWRPDRTARCTASITEHQQQQRAAIGIIRTLELVLISRALKARERARELSKRDTRFAPLARVFAAATAALEDAAREAGDLTGEQFDTGNGIVAYMRGRGILAADMATIDDCGSIVVTPAFLVARRIGLGTLLDMTASFLDALEIHYDLYPEAAPETAADDLVDEGAVETIDAADAVVVATHATAPPQVAGTSPAAAADAAAPQAGSSSSLMERLSSALQT